MKTDKVWYGHSLPEKPDDLQRFEAIGNTVVPLVSRLPASRMAVQRGEKLVAARGWQPSELLEGQLNEILGRRRVISWGNHCSHC